MRGISDNLTTVFMTMSNTKTNQKLDDFVFYSEAYVQTAILIAGLIFNACNYVILMKTKMAVTFRICLLAMSITDACACVFGVIQLVVESVYFRGDIPFGYWHASALASHILYYLFLMFLCASSMYVLLAATVRAYMIARPYKSVEKLKARKLKVICVLIFVIVAVVFLPSPLYAMWQVCYAKDNHTPICVDFLEKLPKVEYMKFYFYALSVIFGPFIIIANIVCLCVIRHALKKSHERSERMTKKEEKKHNYYKRITKMLLIILILDTVWLVPTCIQYLGLVFSPEETVFNSKDVEFVIFDIVAEILLLFRPTYNIFVYLKTNTEYRRMFQKMFCKCIKVSKDTESTMDFDNSITANNSPIKPTAQNGQDINMTWSENGIREQDIDILPRQAGDLGH